jgi:hypothetical protein
VHSRMPLESGIVYGFPSAMDLKDVYLQDSWVLGVETDESHVCFVLDAALEPGNPKFYSPPKPNEQHAYARLRWCLHGEVHWNEGPNLNDPATDATGEVDFGNIDAWWGEQQQVEYLAD